MRSSIAETLRALTTAVQKQSGMPYPKAVYGTIAPAITPSLTSTTANKSKWHGRDNLVRAYNIATKAA